MGLDYEKEKELAEVKHNFKMQELEFERETNRIIENEALFS